MTTKTMLAALQAVQNAMRAEAAAQAAFLNNRSPVYQALWTAARVSTDVAWATLWELNRERVPDPDLTGEQWAEAMRLRSRGMTSDSGGESGDAGV